MGSFRSYLNTMKYSVTTIHLYETYESALLSKSDGELNQDLINYFVSEHNNKNSRAFIKVYLKYRKADTTDPEIKFEIKQLEVPEIKRGGNKHRKKEQKYLTKDQIHSLVNGTDLDFGLMILLMFDGGLRATELLDLRWKDIDIFKRIIKVKHGKGDKFREVSFTPETLVHINKYAEYAEQAEFFFDRTKWNYKKLYDRIQKRGLEVLGMEDLHPHTFRHSCNVYLKKKKIDLETRAKYLGHSSTKTTTDDYGHVENVDAVNEVKQKLEGKH